MQFFVRRGRTFEESKVTNSFRHLDYNQKTNIDTSAISGIKSKKLVVNVRKKAYF